MTDKSMIQLESNTAIGIGRYYRGRILDEFIELEMAINHYIVTYLLLIDDKNTFIKTFLKIYNVTLSKKEEDFEKILVKTSNPIGFLGEELKSLIKIRNIFAHDYLITVLPIENNVEAGTVIYLAKFKYLPKSKPDFESDEPDFDVMSFTEKKLDDLIIRINKAEENVNDLRKKIQTESQQ
ncbi:MAG TPA: hypothetical protein VIM16_07395 [Mucilaginibacter sp.]|jgi:hypothetical protein